MNTFSEMVNSVLEAFEYVPPCESNMFNERGTPVGYYVGRDGRKWSQDGEPMGSPEIIDVTFEEVT